MNALKQLLYDVIDAQYDLNFSRVASPVDLRSGKLRLQLNPTILDRFHAHFEAIHRVYARDVSCHKELAEYMTVRTKRAIHGVNQFVRLTSDDTQALVYLYSRLVRTAFDSLAHDDHFNRFKHHLANIVHDHSSSLQAFLYSIRDASIISSLDTPPVVCGEYSPELQLHLLGIAISRIKPPILDIGCGSNARLVHHLHNHGIEAYGLDRDVTEDPHIVQGDWLALASARDTWGTVISHMAFSNHFIHHHLRKDGYPEAYATAYMNILLSLRTGGSFYYAPALPFIEDLLPPNQYLVTHFPRDGQQPFRSAKVIRL